MRARRARRLAVLALAALAALGWLAAGRPADPCRPSLPGSPRGLPLQFIHIPKAGGTSLNALLQQYAAARGAAFTHYHHAALDRQHASPPGVRPAMLVRAAFDCPAAYPGAGVFTGHRQFGFCRRLLPRARFHAASFREPAARLVSEFDYAVRRFRDHFDPGGARRSGLVQQYWAARDLSALLLEAHAVRQALRAGAKDVPLDAQASAASLFAMCRTQTRLLGDPAGSQARALVDQALDNLDRLDIVLVLDHPDFAFRRQVAAQFQRHLAFPVPAALPGLNAATADKSQLTPAAAAIVHRWSKYDRIVYERAKQRAGELTLEAEKQCNY
ncbi:hypothetical protein BASA81_010798 [Batrachochytrium salamandrivorans]|nr:hypothetical protein BASA81_010798 [Batrachochytrium salamandrivorans]